MRGHRSIKLFASPTVKMTAAAFVNNQNQQAPTAQNRVLLDEAGNIMLDENGNPILEG